MLPKYPMTLIEHAAALFNLMLTPEHAAQFDQFAMDLADWNQRMNLTAITAPDEVMVKHFLDSLSLVKAIVPQPEQHLLDVGTGAGFPGLPLAMILPGLRVTLMEATAKKLAFIAHLIAEFGLKNADTLHARAEDAGQNPAHREHYDIVTARAVARLPILLEYLLPLTKVGGICIAMKGSTAHTELDDSQKALKVLGGKFQDLIDIQLPGIEDLHTLVVIEKIRPTPTDYPRKAGLPTKTPIG